MRIYSTSQKSKYIKTSFNTDKRNHRESLAKHKAFIQSFLSSRHSCHSSMHIKPISVATHVNTNDKTHQLFSNDNAFNHSKTEVWKWFYQIHQIRSCPVN
uniref:Uncharacterized protein n=1 Tax=Onchocerca volvulus TaxID=6282 RepID=A0A8R1Y0L6_ONCVO